MEEHRQKTGAVNKGNAPYLRASPHLWAVISPLLPLLVTASSPGYSAKTTRSGQVFTDGFKGPVTFDLACNICWLQEPAPFIYSSSKCDRRRVL